MIPYPVSKMNQRNRFHLDQFPLILASQSPRRHALFKMMDIPVDVISSQWDEVQDWEGEPCELVTINSFYKARAVSEQYPSRLVIGADTIVVLNGQILGKPENREQALEMLSQLSGTTHTVTTGISILCQDRDVQMSLVESTQVTVTEISDDDRIYYVDTYQPWDKAGSYGIQEWFSVHITHIDGCYYNVMGLPVSTVYAALKFILLDRTTTS